MEEKLLTGKEFGEAIGVSTTTIFNWKERGWLIPAKRTLSNRCYYSQEQVEAYLRGDLDSPILRGHKVDGVDSSKEV